MKDQPKQLNIDIEVFLLCSRLMSKLNIGQCFRDIISVVQLRIDHRFVLDTGSHVQQVLDLQFIGFKLWDVLRDRLIHRTDLSFSDRNSDQRRSVRLRHGVRGMNVRFRSSEAMEFVKNCVVLNHYKTSDWSGFGQLIQRNEQWSSRTPIADFQFVS